MARAVGFDIVHVELGQETYDVKDDRRFGQRPRREHFGFVEGIGQPALQGLSPGSADSRVEQGPGRPRAIAAGEVFLSEPGEGGQTPSQPADEVLRLGSTFLVFRKLEQDVPGFRAFLATQRPGDPIAQKRLAAEFMGRWQEGASLVLGEPPTRPTTPWELDNFGYDEDPDGQKCPLSAHVRRANPRGIGPTGEVQYHRILRRGISYGGPRLPENADDDGEKRGLLFVAANARIDMQFEVIQGQWLNSGEFLGQSGLSRCPMTGANDAGASDSFVGADPAATVTNLPRFVVTRGGDYFFAPGLKALKAIARGRGRFQANEPSQSHGANMAPGVAPSLWDAERLKAYGRELLRPGAPGLLRVPNPPAETAVFVGKHKDVVRILSGEADDDGVDFSVQPFRELAAGFIGDGDLIFGGRCEQPRARAPAGGDKHRLAGACGRRGRRRPYDREGGAGRTSAGVDHRPLCATSPRAPPTPCCEASSAPRDRTR